MVVADDHASSAESVEAMLAAWGVAGARCATGAKALELARMARQRGTRHVVMLADEHLPDMRGIELARTLLKHAGAKSVEIKL